MSPETQERNKRDISQVNRVVYTIGYQRTPLSNFIGELQEATVDAVIDVRLRNTSHLAGYTKRDDLAFLLQEGFGIAYEHHPELAPTKEILDAYREDGDWEVYVRSFLPILRQRDAAGIGEEILARYARPCLLCAEPTAAQCHRRLIAEAWQTAWQETGRLTIIHLEAS
jgi:uncharacterized protein (DUF488 family)